MKKHRQRAFCMVRRTTAVFFMLIFLAGSMDLSAVVKAAAEVRVYITEGTLNHAINRTMTVGEERSGWGIELAPSCYTETGR
ncbi:MAG: hypothetical protein J1F02_11460 [Lachnospiraceae bacterium]|nr:hypothetical protein [Lachnospiraceae bacterium]